MPDLNEQERDEIIEAIRAGRPLPARYRASLFEDAQETELIWPGKTTEVGDARRGTRFRGRPRAVVAPKDVGIGGG